MNFSCREKGEMGAVKSKGGWGGSSHGKYSKQAVTDESKSEAVALPV